jgi:DNA-binding HxlR family transcriptional regulator
MSWLQVVGIIVVAAPSHDGPAIFDMLFKRWMAQILLVLSQRPSRFNELARAVPAGRRMVVERLRELQDTGLVERQVHPGPPIAVTYSITSRGQQLIPHLERLWAEAERLRQSTDARHPREAAGHPRDLQDHANS